MNDFLTSVENGMTAGQNTVNLAKKAGNAVQNIMKGLSDDRIYGIVEENRPPEDSTKSQKNYARGKVKVRWFNQHADKTAWPTAKLPWSQYDAEQGSSGGVGKSVQFTPRQIVYGKKVNFVGTEMRVVGTTNTVLKETDDPKDFGFIKADKDEKVNKFFNSLVPDISTGDINLLYKTLFLAAGAALLKTFGGKGPAPVNDLGAGPGKPVGEFLITVPEMMSDPPGEITDWSGSTDKMITTEGGMLGTLTELIRVDGKAPLFNEVNIEVTDWDGIIGSDTGAGLPAGGGGASSGGSCGAKTDIFDGFNNHENTGKSQIKKPEIKLGAIIIPPNVPIRTYTITYKASERQKPSNSESGKVKISVVQAIPAAHIDPKPGGPGSPCKISAPNIDCTGRPITSECGSGNVTNINSHVRVNGQAATSGQVDIKLKPGPGGSAPGGCAGNTGCPHATPPTGPAVSATEASCTGSGCLSVPANTPEGDYTMEYEVTDKLDPTNVAVGLITVAVAKIIPGSWGLPLGVPPEGFPLLGDLYNAFSMGVPDIFIKEDKPLTDKAIHPLSLVEQGIGLAYSIEKDVTIAAKAVTSMGDIFSDTWEPPAAQARVAMEQPIIGAGGYTGGNAMPPHGTPGTPGTGTASCGDGVTGCYPSPSGGWVVGPGHPNYPSPRSAAQTRIDKINAFTLPKTRAARAGDYGDTPKFEPENAKSSVDGNNRRIEMTLLGDPGDPQTLSRMYMHPSGNAALKAGQTVKLLGGLNAQISAPNEVAIQGQEAIVMNSKYIGLKADGGGGKPIDPAAAATAIASGKMNGIRLEGDVFISGNLYVEGSGAFLGKVIADGAREVIMGGPISP